MSQKKWRGTILFAIIVVVMGGTIGLKLYGLGETQTATTAAVAGRTSGSGTSGTGSTSSTGTGSTGTSTTPSPSATSSPATAPASASRVVTGSTIDTRYGPIQLQVTFSGTTITAITALQTPNEDGRSVSINEQAVPILTQEAMASQSASIDTVSGATYTSEGYMRSLQSAIDQR